MRTKNIVWMAHVPPVDRTSKESPKRSYKRTMNDEIHRNAAEIRSVCKVRLDCGLSCRNCEYYQTKYCTHKAGE